MKRFCTIKDVRDYFKPYKRVRKISIVDNNTPYQADIYIKSWILLSGKQLEEIPYIRPMWLLIKIHNKSLFRKKEFEL
ncbi:hypothetical protein LGL08_20060 [Clostridium estertheticum]|uniref:hypothetical protein n=1 Tax=Clostridium estertheticum TaxID=238834 RepID=UPI001CF3802E|nr:hypothetical protein [Clostridium estertheticum]MCB2309000.1 hypothetical protein [Clostridium estertheticum]MCB2346866.1 hypothetical protein [Clostridium estertheticum]MCB2351822.1 hypothetical protein [Clostridium estertheticum]WAG48426.1 hypothetical protein LL127_22865 [Clostridium estertheticum]